jgi:hypothetical protein
MIRYLYILLLCSFVYSSTAQENYEIQVYGAATMPKGYTMFELHSNYIINGQQNTVNDVQPTHHVFHETIEITHGFTSWFETGFYFFNELGSQNRSTYVGSHIRPRVMAPAEWHLPVGLSLSAEVGYQKREYSEDDWSLEIRPIIDKQWNRIYIAFNPTFDRSLHGYNKNKDFDFSPNVKVNYSVTKKLLPGIEYYGTTGNGYSFAPGTYEKNQLFICMDVLFHPDWEFNCGYGFGLTSATEQSIFKVILGRKIH